MPYIPAINDGVLRLSDKISCSEIEEIMAGLRIQADSSTRSLWFIKYTPLLEYKARRIKKPIVSS